MLLPVLASAFPSVLPRWNRRLSASTALTLATFTVACGGGETTSTGLDDDPPEVPVVTAVRVTPDTTVLRELGGTVELQATARDAAGREISGVTFSWSSSRSEVAAAGSGGTVTARANGGATITAEADGVSGSARILVRAGPLEWTSVEAGLINGCATTTHGTVHCWGENVHGQIGEPSENTDRSATTPLLARGAEHLFMERVNVGGGQTCGLDDQGMGWCWGNGNFGERGDGLTTSRGQWQASPVSGGRSYRHISAGGNHGCAVTPDDVAYCFGLNRNGQLGDGTTTNRLTPARVEGDLSFSVVRAGKAAAANHTCGLTTAGEAFCWGPNGAGQLGDGTTESRPVPTAVDSDRTFTSVAVGKDHSCAVDSDGAAWCWGGNDLGALGDGSSESSLVPVEVDGGLTFSEIDAGDFHTCALTTEGAAWCWGTNRLGQLGDGGTDDRRTPVAVAGGHTFVQLSVGADSNCALDEDRTVWCWGNNLESKLGDGTQQIRRTPIRLADPVEQGSG